MKKRGRSRPARRDPEFVLSAGGSRQRRVAERRARPEMMAAAGSITSAVGGVVTVVVAVAALVSTNQNNVDQRRADRAQRQLAEQGQITDRFSRAVDQLGQQGPGRIDVRVGAVFSLQRIMRDSPAGRDQPAVVELLSTFVKTHSARRSGVPLPADIQVALTVLAERDPAHDGSTGTDLSGADLTAARATGARFEGAHLDRARLVDADLTGAVLDGSSLVGADLHWADLTGARLDRADLMCADLSGTNLTGASLSGVDSGPLGDALPHASYAYTVRKGSVCRVPGHSVLLKGASLINADLTGAKLGGAFLNGAVLYCAKLGGANLSLVTGLTQAQLDGAFVDANTSLPAGLRHPSAPPDDCSDG